MYSTFGLALTLGYVWLKKQCIRSRIASLALGTFNRDVILCVETISYSPVSLIRLDTHAFIAVIMRSTFFRFGIPLALRKTSWHRLNSLLEFSFGQRLSDSRTYALTTRSSLRSCQRSADANSWVVAMLGMKIRCWVKCFAAM